MVIKPITAGIQGTATLISGILNFIGAKDTNKKNYEIYLQDRADRLSAQRSGESAGLKNLALNKRAQEFNEKESVLNRAERTDATAYGRLQGTYQRGADLWAQSMNAQQATVAPLIRRV